jgi:hypothetical protein
MEHKSKHQKIHIIGGAGSGKTTLANRLAEEFGYPNYDLDHIGWGEHGKIPLQKRMEEIEKIVAQPNWITEGVYLWWIDPLLAQADLIIWLDIPYPITSWRIIKRHIKASLRGNNPHAGLKNLVIFLIGVGEHYYRKHPVTPAGPDDDFSLTRAAIKSELGRCMHKVVHCRSAKDIARLQACLVEEMV